MINKERGFTLIEMMIVITIIGILSVGVFIPYNMYSNIGKVRLSKEGITQTLSESRNSAAGLVDADTQKNQNIGLYLKKGENKVTMFSYPYDYTGPVVFGSGVKVLKEVALEGNVTISGLKDSADNDQDSVILYFKAPEGNMSVYDSHANSGSLKKMIIGFNSAISGVLSKEIEIKQ